MKMLKNKMNILLLITLFLPSLHCLSTVPKNQQDPDFQVHIYNGVLQGKKVLSRITTEYYYTFFGIPYAKPPIGNLRFRAPEPPSNWSGILDARNERSQCVQFSEGSEDCLFLNIYTPYTEKTQANRSFLPVMVWIHGGAFIMGSSNYTIYGPDYLIQHNIVMVALNYRLGAFGFLSTGDMASPGNYGLKDQVEALRWVQKNIHHFGGNASEVTIFGESAGAASVHYLLQTPLTNGLFQRAISESGTALCTWSLTSNPKDIAFKVGLAADIQANNTEELINKLRAVDYETLDIAAQTVIFESLVQIYEELPFSPSLEPKHNSAIVTEGSYSILSSNRFVKVPVMLGFNSQEAALLLLNLNLIKPLLAKKDAAPSTLVHESMHISSSAIKLEIGNKIKSFYFGNTSAVAASTERVFDFLSDDMFVRPIRETAKLHSRSVPVYLYRFSFEDKLTLLGNNRTMKGVSHAEELRYIFYIAFKSISKSTNASVITKMVKMWTNFARTGNPTPNPEILLNNVSWPLALTNDQQMDLNFLDINIQLTPSVNPRKDAMEFWDDLYHKYGNPPYDTY